MIVRGTRYVLSKNGFTLIEVLLAVALLAVVSTSALSVFSMGLQIWKRSRQSTALERKAVLALEKISQDLREMIRVKPPEEKFSIKEDALFTYGGKSDQVRIPSVLTEATVSGPGGFARKIYWLDHGKKRLCRSVETAADLFRKRPPVCQALAENVTRLRFRYRLPSGITGSFSWYDDWDMEAGLPFGVEIEMEVTPADRGIEKRVFRRSIAIPVAEIEEKK